MKNKALKYFSDKDLREELESRGNYTRDLWHVEDVMEELWTFNTEYNTNYDITHEQCLDILDNVFSDASGIFESIQWMLRDKYKFVEND